MTCCFEIEVTLRIITTSEDSGALLILLDTNGNLPSFSLSDKSALDMQIFYTLQTYFYENDLYPLLANKSISYVSNAQNKLNITYNMISTSSVVKTGSFVKFNKQSIELYRIINNHYQA